MNLDPRTFLTIGCLLLATLACGARGEESGKSRSISSHVIRPLETRRPNSLHSEDGAAARNRNFPPMDFSGYSNYLERANANSTWGRLDDDSRKLYEEEERLFRETVSTKDYDVSSASDLVNFDRIGERMIARANITEEAKRVVRQVKKQRPGLFWTLARVAFETVNETRSAIQQISTLVEANFSPENPPSTTTQISTTTAGNSTESSRTTTTEEPFKLTVTDFQTLIRRNFRGLVRLFNIEWQDALNQSQTNVREFQRDLGNRISPFLQDNPDVV